MKGAIRSLLSLCFIASGAVSAWAMPYTYTLDQRGDTFAIGSTGAVATEFTSEMQTTVSSGTGVIMPFLTLDAGGSKLIEQGVNTDGSPLPFNDKRPHWTKSLTLGTLQSADYHFLLDVNQEDSSPIISLDEFKVWLLPASAGGSLVTRNNVSTYSDLATLLTNAGGSQVFDLGPNNILIDYSLWSGSGNNLDMDLHIPSIAGSSSDFLYVWSKFSGNNDGYEEWAVRPENNTTPVPEPGTCLLLGVGLFGLSVYRKRRTAA